jgi:hypothetical protein
MADIALRNAVADELFEAAHIRVGISRWTPSNSAVLETSQNGKHSVVDSLGPR